MTIFFLFLALNIPHVIIYQYKYYKYIINVCKYISNLWVSLVAQAVKNQPTIRETWVLPLGWEDPLEEGMATHSSILAWRIPMNRGA